MKVGFIGLGKMGQGMARNLLRAVGASLVVHDANPSAMQALVSDGAQAASSVAELARQVDVVFTSLPGPPQVEEVALGANGLLDNLRPGAVLFDLSTSSRSLACRIHSAFEAKGLHLLDAPISGGPAGAASGELAIWVGGDQALFDRHLELLRAMAKMPRYVGAIGAGCVTKLCHNASGYMIMQALAESFSLAVKAGVDPLELWEAMRLGMVGRGSPMDMLVKQFLPGTYEPPAFALKLAHKDVSLATAMGRELGVPLRMANLTLEEMTEALGRGFGEQDSRAYLKLQLERAGVKIAVDPERLKKAVEAAAQRP